MPCNPNPCPQPGACCYPDGRCEYVLQSQCYTGDWRIGVPCSPNSCPQPPPCSKQGMEPAKRNLLIRAAGSVGRGRTVNLPGDRVNCGGTLLLNFDGSAENGYCWQYAGVAPPYYGAFAECYSGTGDVCGVELKLTGIGYPCTSCDIYLWGDAGGMPGGVVGTAHGFNPCPVATWPNISTHDACVPLGSASGPFWVGFWTCAAMYQVCPYFIAADTNGFGGCPRTNIAPGIGYPTGWNNASVVWGPVQSIGIGAWLGGMGTCATPVQESTWGRIKSLFH